jgi:hypothetical protein
MRSAQPCCALELLRSAAKGLAESGGEMAVAGKTQIQSQAGEIVAFVQKMERAPVSGAYDGRDTHFQTDL